jgi:hypothetical protein
MISEEEDFFSHSSSSTVILSFHDNLWVVLTPFEFVSIFWTNTIHFIANRGQKRSAMQIGSTAAALNCHGIIIQGLLRLEWQKSQQQLNPFDLIFFFLDQALLIECLSWLPIFICTILGHQIWISTHCLRWTLNFQWWISWEQSIVSVWKIHLYISMFSKVQIKWDEDGEKA